MLDNNRPSQRLAMSPAVKIEVIMKKMDFISAADSVYRLYSCCKTAFKGLEVRGSRQFDL